MTRFFQLRTLSVIIVIALSVACSKDTDKKPDTSPINWMGMTEGIAQATKERKLIFVDIYADWCGPCKYMDATTYMDSSVAQILNSEFVPVKVDADSEEKIPCESDQQALPMECAAQIWQVSGLPGTIILDAQGYFLTSTMGIQESKGLIESLKMLLSEKEKLLSVVENEKSKAQNTTATQK